LTTHDLRLLHPAAFHDSRFTFFRLVTFDGGCVKWRSNALQFRLLGRSGREECRVKAIARRDFIV
ncbi:MAG TPA: hypothetical protein VGB61_09270, partial [Pyrinomonadaceae bacterium]